LPIILKTRNNTSLVGCSGQNEILVFYDYFYPCLIFIGVAKL